MKKFSISIAVLVLLVTCWRYVPAQQAMQRHSELQEGITAATAVASSTAISLRAFSGAMVETPAGESGQDYDVYVSKTETGTYLPLYDSTGTQVSITVAASRWQELPAAIFAAPYMKLQADTTTRSGLNLYKKG
jgi:hypothetical protein